MHGTAGTHMVLHAWYCMHGTACMVLHGTAGTHMQDTHSVWCDTCRIRGMHVHPPRVLASCRCNCWLLPGPLTQRRLHHLYQIIIIKDAPCWSVHGCLQASKQLQLTPWQHDGWQLLSVTLAVLDCIHKGLAFGCMQAGGLTGRDSPSGTERLHHMWRLMFVLPRLAQHVTLMGKIPQVACANL